MASLGLECEVREVVGKGNASLVWGMSVLEVIARGRQYIQPFQRLLFSCCSQVRGTSKLEKEIGDCAMKKLVVREDLLSDGKFSTPAEGGELTS